MKIFASIFSLTPVVVTIATNMTVKLQYHELCCPVLSKSSCLNILSTLAIAHIVILAAIALKKVSIAIRIISVSIYPFICFVLPGFIYLKVEKRCSCRFKTMRLLSVILVILMIIYSLYGTITVINDL